jgi:hypothetical protein
VDKVGGGGGGGKSRGWSTRLKVEVEELSKREAMRLEVEVEEAGQGASQRGWRSRWRSQVMRSWRMMPQCIIQVKGAGAGRH